MNIPIQNIYYMLLYAWRKNSEKEIVDVDAINTTNLLDLFAKVLVNGLYHLVKRGFDRDYRAVFEDVRTLKGKIDFQQTINGNLLKQGKVHCHFDEFDENNLQNQIIKATVRNLISTEKLNVELKGKLIGLRRRFTRVGNISLNNTHFKSLTFNSNNKFYEFLLKVCKEIYNNLIPTEKVGKYKFRRFSEDRLDKLFEEFVREFYFKEQEQLKIKSEKLQWDVDELTPGSLEYIPEMRTDISLVNERQKIIIDTKFYKDTMSESQWGNKTINSSHLYQIFAYMQNTKLIEGQELRGILLYPTVDTEYNISVSYHNQPISARTINLNQDWQGIHNDLINIIN